MSEQTEQTNFNSFIGYKQMVMELTGDLKKLKEYSEKLDLKANGEAIDEVLNRLAADTFSVAIIGEFKRGKSTLINALLGKNILPTDVLPTTATLNRITYSIKPFVKIEYKDDRSEEIDIEKLNDYVTKLTDESEKVAKTIKEATVYYPINYCKNNIDIIDTPGLNDDEAMTEVTLSVLPKIDAALMVIMAQAPFSESERAFLENKLITSDLGRVLFVVTGIDLLDEDDVDRVLKSIADRIEQHVMSKAAKTMGENSKEFETYKRKIGKVRVFGLSAKKALKAKMSGNDEMLEQSCFPTFEKALERFLTEDRGAVMLGVPVSRIQTSAVEIFKSIELSENAMKMKKEEFEEKYNIAMNEIEEIRAQKREELNKISTSAQKAYDEIKPLMKSLWPELEQTAVSVIDNYPLNPEDISSQYIEATQTAIMEKIKKETSQVGQVLTEKIQNGISQALENEAERLHDFEKSFFEATEKIQNLFSANAKGSDTADAVVGTIISSVVGYGIGGIYMGFKEGGWKGALLGGATGFAGTLGASLGFGLLVSAISLPLTWPVLLVGGIASAIAGTFTSKFALNNIFKDHKIDKFKEAYKEKVLEQFAEMRRQDNFSENVRSQVDTAFNALKNKIETETENVLSDTQATLTQLKVKMAENTVATEKEQEELKNMVASVNTILKHAEVVNQQLVAVLNR